VIGGSDPWAQHVLADGHRGLALREYMRDYNHWYTLGVLCELLPLPDNRVTVVSDLTDPNGIPAPRARRVSLASTTG
jgi:hypothetical protein